MIALSALCGCHREGADKNRDVGVGAMDLGVVDASSVDASPCGDMACAGAQVCRFDSCIDPPPACTSDAQCEDDSYCEMDECIPYGVGPRGAFNPACETLQLAGVFAPKPKCEWTAPPAGDPFPNHHNVLVTPLVVDFDFDDDPTTLHPSIVFQTYNCEDGGSGQETNCWGVIRVIDGNTCALEYSIGSTNPAVQMIGSVTPAIGDLDGDGRPDIVTERIQGGVVGFKFDPTANAGQGDFVPLWTTYASINSVNGHWDSLSIHDLDDDGVPEILQNGPYPTVYSNTGQFLDGPMGISTTYASMLHPVAADVDGDGQVEMIDGREMFRFDKVMKKWSLIANTTAQPLGQTAIGDFGTFGVDPANDDRSKLDGIPEIAVVSSGAVRVQTLSGPVTIPGVDSGGQPDPGVGGAPTIGDFDGDGRAEIGVAGKRAYAVFDPDCRPGASATECAALTTNGVLWSQASQDASSNMTGSSVFDFDGDGRAEVVYADECFSRAYDGQTGTVLFSQFHTSCTWYENPIIADVNGDLRADMVIPSNSNCNISCPTIDPIDNGVRCDTTADCPGTTPCVREMVGDKFGLCRCGTPSDCGSASLTCTDPVAGPSAMGKVCRASHPAATSQRGILVMHDAQDRWVYSRAIWNQHAYSVTNVNDDGTIPKTSLWKKNWADPKLNNFRMNVQGALNPLAVPDLTASGTGPPGVHVQLACTNGTVALQAKICNRGAGPVGAGVPVTFYRGKKSDNSPICTAISAKKLVPGDCDTVSCNWDSAPTSPTDVAVYANDDGTGMSTTNECESANNLGTLLGVECEIIP